MTDDIAARLRQQARNRYADLADGELAARQTVEWAAADEIEALRAFRERDKGEIESLRETVETLMRGSRAGELIDEANALRDDLRQATTKLGAAEARIRELEAERDKWDRRVAYDELQAREYENRATQQRQIDALTIRAESAERELAEAYERAAKEAEKIGAPYVLNTGTGAMMFRAATDKIATAIRKLGQEVKHEAE